ncbi:hypothetical protein QE109_02125 [Fusibacter bizertensis]|uniref:Uncharacterized protein n=1 Tax=Fusibacter bizertensis TaxID=1488331 RepID=A0ABT6N935_9FIRM|nr:hypothetical protein [Fusibacter bizertensis]MDH8676923.1 hypothetical protein [Fusibacter bizertensis]
MILNCDDLEKTYIELKEKGVNLAPPRIAEWGGLEVTMKCY